MSLQFKLIDTANYLLCEVNGERGDPQESIDYFLQVLLRCRSSALPRVLIDMREVRGTSSAVEKIIFYEKIIDKYEVYLKFGGLPIRLVFLVNSDKLNNYNPGLEVAEHRNFPAIIESDIHRAIDWLTEAEPTINTATLKS